MTAINALCTREAAFLAFTTAQYEGDAGRVVGFGAGTLALPHLGLVLGAAGASWAMDEVRECFGAVTSYEQALAEFPGRLREAWESGAFGRFATQYAPEAESFRLILAGYSPTEKRGETYAIDVLTGAEHGVAEHPFELVRLPSLFVCPGGVDGEFVTRATSVNAMTMPILDAINRTGRVSGMGANDNGRFFADQNRVLLAGFRAIVQTLEDRLERVETAVTRQGQATTRAIERKPTPKPATVAA